MIFLLIFIGPIVAVSRILGASWEHTAYIVFLFYPCLLLVGLAVAAALDAKQARDMRKLREKRQAEREALGAARRGRVR